MYHPRRPLLYLSDPEEATMLALAVVGTLFVTSAVVARVRPARSRLDDLCRPIDRDQP